MIDFDEVYYLANNPDVFHAVRSGIFSSGRHHFEEFGAAEFRDPHPLFSTRYYLSENSDVRHAVEAGLFFSGWEHFLTFGLKEGRAPSPGLAQFHDAIYLAANPDVDAAVRAGILANGLTHYMAFGAAEGRSPGIASVTLTADADRFTASHFYAPPRPLADGSGLMSSLGSNDELTGFGENALLSAMIARSVPTGENQVIRPGLTNIQLLDLTFTSGAAALALDRATGIRSIRVWAEGGPETIQLTGLSDAASNRFELAGVNGPVDVLIGYGSGVLSGEQDQGLVQLQGSRFRQLTISDGAGGFDQLTIDSSKLAAGNHGPNYIASLQLPALADLTITGNHALELNVSDTAVGRVTATALQAPLALTTRATVQSVELGAGDDWLLLDLTPATGGALRGQQLSGGDGLDQLVLKSDSNLSLDGTALSAISGFERLLLTGPASARHDITLSDSFYDANAQSSGPQSTGLMISASGVPVTLDLTGLTGQRSVRYNGDVAGDHIILTMAQLPWQMIDGGSASYMTVHDGGTVNAAGLADIHKISFAGTAGQTVSVQMTLDDQTLDRLVNASQPSSALSPDRLMLNFGMHGPTNGTVAAGNLSERSAIDVTLGAGRHQISSGAGADNILLLPGSGADIRSGSGDDEVIIIGNFASGRYAGYQALGQSVSGYANNRTGALAPDLSADLGAGLDSLRTYGAVNLTGTTLTGVERLIAHSAVVITAAQYRALISAADAVGYAGDVIEFSGQDTHQLRIIGDDGPTLDLSRIGLRNSGNSTIPDQVSILYVDFRKANGDVMPNGVSGLPKATPAETGLILVGSPVSANPTNGVTETIFISGPGHYVGYADRPASMLSAPWLTSFSGVSVTGGAGGEDTLYFTVSLPSGYPGDGGQGGSLTGLGRLVYSGSRSNDMIMPASLKHYVGSAAGDRIDAALWSPVTGSILFGAGDDQLLNVAAGLIGQVTLSGGDGNDQISFTGLNGTAVSWSNLTGFETINFGTPTAATEVNGLPDSAVRAISLDSSVAALTLTLSADQVEQLTSVSVTGSHGAILRLTDEGAGFADLTGIDFHGNAGKVTIDLSDLSGNGPVNVMVGNSLPNIIGHGVEDHVLVLAADLGAGATMTGISDIRVVYADTWQTGLTLADNVALLFASAGGSFRLGNGGTAIGVEGNSGYILRGGSGNDDFTIDTAAGISNTILASGGRDTILLSAETGYDLITLSVASGAHNTTSSADLLLIQNFDVTTDRIGLDLQYMGNSGQPVLTGTEIATGAHLHDPSFDLVHFSGQVGGYSEIDLAAPDIDGTLLAGHLGSLGVNYQIAPGDRGYMTLASDTNALYLYLFRNGDMAGAPARALAAGDLQLIAVVEDAGLPASFADWSGMFVPGGNTPLI